MCRYATREPPPLREAGFTLTERRDDLQFAHIETNVPGLQIGLNAVPDAKGTGSAILNINSPPLGETRQNFVTPALSLPHIIPPPD